MSTNFTELHTSFWDESPISSNGFEAVVNHVNQTFEKATRFIEVMSVRVEIIDSTSKSINKLSRTAVKHQKIDKLFTHIGDVWASESTIYQKFTEEFTKNNIDKFHESLKKNVEVMKKAKLDTSNAIRTRKTQFETTNKSCKNYTSKYRMHELLVKKSSGMELDEKISKKLSISLQGVKLAEKELKVDLEMLNQNMEDYEKSFVDFCAKATNLDATVWTLIENVLHEFYKLFPDISREVITKYEKFNALPEESKTEAHIQRFITDKGNPNAVFKKFVYISESLEGDQADFQLNFSTDPSFKAIFNVKEGGSTQSVPPPSIPNPPPTEKASTSHNDTSKTLKAIYAYEAKNPDELTFNVGDILTIVSKEDETWYIGRLQDGTTGAFPISYCEEN